MTEPQAMRPKSLMLIRELMKSKELTVRDMADRLPVGKSTVGNLLTGKQPTCSPELADRISEVLDIDSAVLFAPSVSAKRGRPSTRSDAAA